MLTGFNRSITWTWFNQPQLITGLRLGFLPYK